MRVYPAIIRTSLAFLLSCFLLCSVGLAHAHAETPDSPAAASAGICDLNTAQREYLDQLPPLRVGIDIAWPPFEYVDEQGRYRGMAAEYIGILRECTGLDLRIQKDLAWHEVRKGAREGEIDIFSCAVSTPLRREFMHFTQPYLSFPTAIITRDDAPFVRDIDELRDKLIVVGSGYATEEHLREHYPDLSILGVPHINQALRMVFRGEAHAFIGNIATAGYYMKQLGYTNLRVAGEIPFRFQLSVGVRKDMPQLRAIFDQILSRITEEQQDEIYYRWINLQYKSSGLDWKRVWQLSALSAAVILLILGWNYSLRREIRRRHRAESELSELNQNLNQRAEREVELRLQAETDRQVQEQVMIQQAKMASLGEMIGAIAHQWRQPLSSLSLGIQEVQEWDELSPEEQAALQTQLHDNVEFLIQTMEAFGDFFRFDQRQDNFEPLPAIEDTLSLLEPLLERNAIQTRIQAGPDVKQAHICGCRNQFQQVVLNLVNNAREAMEQQQQRHGLIDIQALAADNQLVISISDNAGGIPSEMLDRLFDSFVTSKRDSGGTGIGLPLAKRILDGMGGSIQARNTEQGAEFRLQIPLSPPNSDQHQSPPG